MIVYWAPWTSKHLSYIEHPSVNRLTKSAFKGMKNLTELGQSYHRCPAVQDYFENIFELKSPVDFEIIRSPDGGFYTEYYDQDFWNEFVLVRNENLLSFNIFYLFIPETDLSIEITSPYFTDNDFANKTMVVPGKFNAYRWIRPIQCTFAIKDNVDRIKINRGDTLIYLRMMTNETIKLKKFFITEPVVRIVDQNLQVKDRNFKRFVHPYAPIKMIKWYEMFESSKVRKIIMNEVKKNTVE
jgi:hypothetical protein